MSMDFWGEMWAGETNTGAVTVALTATRLDANVRGQHMDRKEDQRLSLWACPHLSTRKTIRSQARRLRSEVRRHVVS